MGRGLMTVEDKYYKLALDLYESAKAHGNGPMALAEALRELQVEGPPDWTVVGVEGGLVQNRAQTVSFAVRHKRGNSYFDDAHKLARQLADHLNETNFTPKED